MAVVTPSVYKQTNAMEIENGINMAFRGLKTKNYKELFFSSVKRWEDEEMVGIDRYTWFAVCRTYTGYLWHMVFSRKVQKLL